jgi:hypothetical protein
VQRGLRELAEETAANGGSLAVKISGEIKNVPNVGTARYITEVDENQL